MNFKNQRIETIQVSLDPANSTATNAGPYNILGLVKSPSTDTEKAWMESDSEIFFRVVGGTSSGHIIGGSGTSGTIPKWTGTYTLSNSSITDNGAILSSTDGALVFTGTGTAPSGTQVGLGQNASNGLVFNTISAGVYTFGFGGGGVVFLENNGLYLGVGAIVMRYAGITTAGQGVPPIFTGYNSGSKSAALTAVGSYTPPAAAGSYEINAVLYCTVGTTTSFSVKVNYRDENGTPHSDVLSLIPASTPGAFLASGLVVAAGTYYAVPITISIDNSATPITFSTVGTFTTVTYFLTATAKQVI